MKRYIVLVLIFNLIAFYKASAQINVIVQPEEGMERWSACANKLANLLTQNDSVFHFHGSKIHTNDFKGNDIVINYSISVKEVKAISNFNSPNAYQGSILNIYFQARFISADKVIAIKNSEIRIPEKFNLYGPDIFNNLEGLNFYYFKQKLTAYYGLMDFNPLGLSRIVLKEKKLNIYSKDSYYYFSNSDESLNEGKYKVKNGEIELSISYYDKIYVGKYVGDYSEIKIYKTIEEKKKKQELDWPHGKGTFTAIGLSIEGDWLDGALNGLASIVKNDLLNDDIEYTYKGNIKNNERTGQGEFLYNGIKYTGNWEKDKINGIGTLESKYGIYKGAFLNNKRQGEGQLFIGDEPLKDPKIWVKAVWNNDILNGNGIFIRRYSYNNNGRIINSYDTLVGKISGYILAFTGKGTSHFSGVYRGDFVNSIYDGNGLLTNGLGDYFEGQFKAGEFVSGKTISKYTYGGKYTGEIKNGKKNGQGKYIDTGGNVYDGIFTDDKFTGIGKINNSDWSYEGEIVLNEPKGKGVKIFTNGDAFDGVFTDDKFTGIGKINNSDWSYDGEVVNYQPNGKGVKIFTNRDTLTGTWNEFGFNGIGKRREAAIEGSDEFYYTEGTWKNGQLNGEGTRYFKMRAPSSSGEDEIFIDATYTGQFINGIFNGKGNLHFYDLSYCSIDGDWINGLCPKGQISCEYGASDSGRCVTSYNGDLSSNFNKQGFGTFTDCDGSTYVGNFENDSENGQGKLTYKNGKIEQGTFVNGVFQIPFICKKVSIGNQVWTAENLNVAKFRNGELIPQIKTLGEWQKASNNNSPAWCYYDFNPANGVKYGKLYNWYAVSDSRGLAPAGWHVPTENEFDKLINNFGDEKSSIVLKSKTGWVDQVYGTRNESGNNESGFTGLPGGELELDKNYYFTGKGYSTDLWTSECCKAFDSSASYFFLSVYGCGTLDNNNKGRGHYVRLFKD